MYVCTHHVFTRRCICACSFEHHMYILDTITHVHMMYTWTYGFVLHGTYKWICTYIPVYSCVHNMYIVDAEQSQKRAFLRKNANNATHNLKLGKKRRESSKRNYYIISARVIIKAIIIMNIHCTTFTFSNASSFWNVLALFSKTTHTNYTKFLNIRSG